MILNLQLAASGLQVEEGFPATPVPSSGWGTAYVGVSRESTLFLWAPPFQNLGDMSLETHGVAL